MKKIFTFMVAFAAAVAFTTVDAAAYKVNDDNVIYGYGQVWAILSEQSDNSVKDAVTSKDNSAFKDVVASDKDKTSFGFKGKRLRFGIKGNIADGAAYYNAFFDGSSGTVLLHDYWFGLNLMDGALKLQLGQFRPFVTWATGIAGSAGLKNIERSDGLKKINTLFYPGGSAGWRDRGLLLAYGNMSKDPLAVTFSATNGTGAGTFRDVGGDVSSAQVKSNGGGEAAYVLGLVGNLLDNNLRLNASFGKNKHDGAVVNGNVVGVGAGDYALYLDRSSYSAGFLFKAMEGAVWVDGEIAQLKINEKDTLNGKKGVTVAGVSNSNENFETVDAMYFRAGYYILPGELEAVLRYGTDKTTYWGNLPNLTKKYLENTETVLTLNYYMGSAFKTQFEYVSREYDKDIRKFLGDDKYKKKASTIRVNLQAKF